MLPEPSVVVVIAHFEMQPSKLDPSSLMHSSKHDMRVAGVAVVVLVDGSEVEKRNSLILFQDSSKPDRGRVGAKSLLKFCKCKKIEKKNMIFKEGNITLKCLLLLDELLQKVCLRIAVDLQIWAK